LERLDDGDKKSVLDAETIQMITVSPLDEKNALTVR
jgi:hypothetical protein